MVNHWGTIILAEPLELPDDGRRYIDEETDWDYKRQIRAELIAEQDLPKGASIFYEPPKSF